jgi:hypothetical protein
VVAIRTDLRAVLSAHSATTAFWLDVHDRLRRDAAGLDAAGEDYRSGHSTPAQLAVIAAPRLHGLIAAMQGHHQIEDFEYFPEFRRAAPNLAPGFDRLERDHATLSHSVDAALAALAELRAAVDRSVADTTLQLAARRYLDAAASLSADLLRHLHDEENLVVPLLERGTTDAPARS